MLKQDGSKAGGSILAMDRSLTAVPACDFAACGPPRLK
jgi:hypothetical protein